MFVASALARPAATTAASGATIFPSRGDEISAGGEKHSVKTRSSFAAITAIAAIAASAATTTITALAGRHRQCSSAQNASRADNRRTALAAVTALAARSAIGSCRRTINGAVLPFYPQTAVISLASRTA